MNYKIVLLFIFLMSSTFINAQTKTINIFLNCQSAKCYADYLRTELSLFNFVRDQASADVIILVTSSVNGSGGRNMELNFDGQNEFISKVDTLKFSLKQDDTDDISRKKMLNHVSLGLLYFVRGTSLEENVKVNFQKIPHNTKIIKPDSWNNWIFGLGANGRLSGESNRKNIALEGNLRGGKTTEKSKFSFYTYYNNRVNTVVVDSISNTIKINDYGFNSLYVKSFTNHWSVGGFVKGFHSVYQNIQFSKSFAPALEYSVFPVQSFNRKQFRWIYQAGIRDFNYLETTVFDKLKETIPYQQLTGILGFTQNWGNFSAEISGYQYLHDTKLYRLSLELDFTIRVAQGLSLRFLGNGSQINNQISLPKVSGDATNILLGGRQLATSFSYATSFGLNYSFGSMNNSIVNPRFSGVN